MGGDVMHFVAYGVAKVEGWAGLWMAERRGEAMETEMKGVELLIWECGNWKESGQTLSHLHLRLPVFYASLTKTEPPLSRPACAARDGL
jgi:hypothetical protein